MASDRNAVIVHDHWDDLVGGYLYPLMTPESIDACIDKHRSAEVAAQAGIPGPQTYFLDTTTEARQVTDAVSYPCIIKPISQALVPQLTDAQRPPEMRGKVWRAPDRPALEAILRAAQSAGTPVVVQGEVGGPESPIFSCCVAVSQRGELLARWTGTKLRKLPLSCGTATLAEARWAPRVAAAADQVVGAFGLRGVCEIEFALAPESGTPCLIEVNPRPWVWVALAQRSGTNLPFVVYCDLTGFALPRLAERDGVLWTSLWLDWTAYRRSSGTKGARRLLLPLGYASSFRRWPEFAYFTWDDMVPGLIGAAHFVTQDLRHKLIDSQAGTG